MTNIEFERHNRMVKELVLIDGLLRSGKSLLGSILGSFARMEIIHKEPFLEALPLFYYFDKISKDAAVTLLRREADIKLYHLMISRNANFRIGDFTGVFNNVNTFKYFRRLFSKDGGIVLEKIKKERPIFQIEVHEMLQMIDLYFEAFGEGLRVIEMVRHPLDLVHTKNISRYGAFLKWNPLSWDLTIKNRSGYIPYYAFGWINEFLKESPIDRTIKIVQRLLKGTQDKYESLSQTQKRQVLFVPFEEFVICTHKYLDLISNFIGSDVTKKTRRVLKKEKVPRKIDLREKERTMSLIKKEASPECIKILNNLINEYEEKYFANLNIK